MIPQFDHNLVLPPHLADPTVPSHVSPYLCGTTELCARFATSLPRIAILEGLLRFRGRLNEIGLIEGFQWLDGSFLEDIEQRESRPPNDLDIVTFYKCDDEKVKPKLESFMEFKSPKRSKANYMLDHYAVDMGYQPAFLIEGTRYWVQLFSHNRDGTWKGMLRIELNTGSEDAQALNLLQERRNRYE